MAEKYERKCKNWLASFRDWTLPRSQSPESVLMWTGLFTLASAVRRHVKVPKKYLGSWECYPHVYVMFVAPPGVVNKSTSIGYAEELLESLGDKVTKAPEAMSVPALIEKMIASPDSSAYIVASDFPVLIQKAGVQMYEMLTRMFDGAKRYDEGTISRGLKFIESPVVNMIAGANPKWITANIPEDVLGGGFASRMIPIYEEEPRAYQMYYHEIVDPKVIESLGNDLKEDLEHIANDLYGDFEITKEALDFMENWYQKIHVKQQKTSDPKMIGFNIRKPAYVHKVAMLYHMAYSDDLILTKDDFQAALDIMKSVESRVSKTFRNIGKNKYISTIDGIESYIKMKKKVPKWELYEMFSPDAEPSKLEDLIQGCLIMEKIKVIVHNGDTYYVDPTADMKEEFRVIEKPPANSHESQAALHSLYHEESTAPAAIDGNQVPDQ